MIRTRLAGTRLLFVGLAVAAVVTGSAAAATPVLAVSVHARLAPVAGAATSAGHFGGLLVKPGQPMGAEPSPTPRFGTKWRLSWKLSLPTLSGETTVSLHVPARNGAPTFVHVLCTGCTSSTHGAVTLTNSQALRIAESQASVVVRSSSAMLRGAVKAQTSLPTPRG